MKPSENTGIVAACRRLAESGAFQSTILTVILANGVLVGLETSRPLVARHATLFGILNGIVVAIFMGELAVRLVAQRLQVGAFLRDGWNLFDTAVVLLSLLPGVGSFATIARIARVLRVARLVSVSPKLRLIIGTMMRSIPSLAHVSLLLALLLYIYAVVGVNLFGATDAAHWGSLGTALLTLFQMLTLEGWVELQAASMAVHPWAWVYYGSFVVLAVFVVVNLFIAVVLNNLDELREEDRQAALAAAAREEKTTGGEGFENHLAAIRGELDRLEAAYRAAAKGAPPRDDLRKAG